MLPNPPQDWKSHLLQKRGAWASIIGIPLAVILACVGYWLTVHFATGHGREASHPAVNEKVPPDYLTISTLRESTPSSYDTAWISVPTDNGPIHAHYRSIRVDHCSVDYKGITRYLITTDTSGDYLIDEALERSRAREGTPEGNAVAEVLRGCYDIIVSQNAAALRAYFAANACDVFSEAQSPSGRSFRLNCGLGGLDMFIVTNPLDHDTDRLTGFVARRGGRTVLTLAVDEQQRSEYDGTNGLFSMVAAKYVNTRAH